MVYGFVQRLIFPLSHRVAAEDEVFGSFELVAAAHGGIVRGVLEQFRLGAGFFGDLEHRVGKAVERLDVLGFGRLNHQRFVNDQREVVRRRVEIVIHESLGDIQGVDIRHILPETLEHEFMHAGTVIGQDVGAFQFFLQVIGVEDGFFGNIPQTFLPKHGDIGEGADEDAEVPMEGFDAPDALFGASEAVGGRGLIIARIGHDDMRVGEVIDQFLADHDRTAAGTSAAVGGGEGFVEVVVHDVNAALAGLEHAKQGVHVGAVAIDQTASFVDNADDFGGVLVEQAERVGVSEHQTGKRVITERFEGFEIHIAALIRR